MVQKTRAECKARATKEQERTQQSKNRRLWPDRARVIYVVSNARTTMKATRGRLDQDLRAWLWADAKRCTRRSAASWFGKTHHVSATVRVATSDRAGRRHEECLYRSVGGFTSKKSGEHEL